ncbi:unnamed protein product [Rotaria sp. Silwood1]|nr:unnamed protein product [Rotaria sp. Silwood1]
MANICLLVLIVFALTTNLHGLPIPMRGVAVLGDYVRWPSGIVPYTISSNYSFRHEQSRPDRDDYVRVIWENIIPGKENNFRKYNTSEVDTVNTPYDFDSIMHYGRNFFSINGSDTLVALNSSITFGETDTLSFYDIQAIRNFYGCSQPIATTTTSTITTTKTTTSTTATTTTKSTTTTSTTTTTKTTTSTTATTTTTSTTTTKTTTSTTTSTTATTTTTSTTTTTKTTTSTTTSTTATTTTTSIHKS